MADGRAPIAVSSQTREFLQGVAGFRVVASRQAVGPGDLADVDVTARVRRDAMWGHECARGAAVGAAPVEQHISGEIEYVDAAGEVVLPERTAEVCRAGRPPERGDVDQPLRVDVDVGWPLDVVPDLEQGAVEAKDLHPVVLPV